MIRTARLPLLAAALVSLAAPLALGVTVSPAHARAGAHLAAAPELNLRTLPGPGNPLRVARLDRDDPPPSPEACVAASGDAYDDACFNVSLAISATAPLADVTVTVVEHRGLYVDPLVTTIDALETGRTRIVNYAVRARTTGLHTLTFEVTAPGAEPLRVGLPYVWRSGGAPLPGGDSLAGRLYAHSGLGAYPCAAEGECTYRHTERLAFVDETRLSRALAKKGRVGCGTEDRCPTYRYDSSTGLVQVGRHQIGRVTQRAAYLDGVRYARLAYPRVGSRLEGEWFYGADVDEGRGVVEQHLTLHETGRFRLLYFVDTHRYPDSPTERTAFSHRMRGTYEIGPHGRLRLNDNLRKLTEYHTLALVTTARGRPRPHSRGIWLDVVVKPSPRGRHFVDGNLLSPLPRSVS